MRIGLSTSVIQRGQTGIGQHLLALLREFTPYSIEHRFVLFALEQDLSLFDFAKNHFELIKVSERFRPPLMNILWHQFALPKLARSHNIDVLHVPSYRRLLWQRPCRLVATIHDLAPFRVARKYDPLRMLYGRVIVKFLARRQHALIAVSQNTAKDIHQFFGIPNERLTIIHNGIDHARFFPGARQDAKTRMAEQHHIAAPFFLYVARLEHPGKNHVRLIEAFNRFKVESKSEWTLALAGADWSGAQSIHAAIRDSPFADSIRCLGFVSDEQLPTLYRAADVFVYPSLYEGFGMPPVEAMACGCPVMCSTRGALGEIVGDAAALADPEDVEDMKRQLVRLAGESSLRERLRAAGLGRARCFDWNTAAAQTLDVYRRVLSRSRRREEADFRC